MLILYVDLADQHSDWCVLQHVPDNHILGQQLLIQGASGQSHPHHGHIEVNQQLMRSNVRSFQNEALQRDLSKITD